jgi:tRNA (mo5U34)-methyltransferase
MQLQERVNALPWHHQIDFGNGIVRPGNTPLGVLQQQAEIYFKDRVNGLTVLDVGCWDGFNSFEAKRRGAARVLATDHFAWSDECWGSRESFELARTHLAIEVEVRDIDIPDLAPGTVGLFDVVLFLGVFYHLRNPFAALENVSRLCEKTIVVESHLDARDIDRPAMVFYPTDELAGDSTNWWGPNPACMLAMLADLGFSRVEYTEHPVHPSRGIFHGHREARRHRRLRLRACA